MLHNLPVVLAGIYLLGIYAYVRVLVHELGNALGAYLVGWEVVRFSIGVGKRRTLFRIGEFRLGWGPWPTTGLVDAFTKSRALFRWRFVIFVSGWIVTTATQVLVLAYVYIALEDHLW